MNINVVLIVLIISFLAVTIFSLTAMLFMRRRDKEREKSNEIAKTIEELDTALNAAINEINKLGTLIQTEVDEKYKAMLLLYTLIEEKQKEIAELSGNESISEMMSQYMETHEEKFRALTENSISVSEDKEVEDKGDVTVKRIRPASFANPKHEQIWDLRETGLDIPGIAKELDMGQGEIKLILYLMDKVS